MARYSDSDDDYKSKKKSKRRSRSRSSSVDSYSRRKHKKKKSKSKKSVRSRSNSSERSYRSSRSKTSRRSRSRSRDRRSRSRDRTRRSRSRDRYSRSRRSRSPSASRSRYRRSRSKSASRSRRSSRSPSTRSRSQRSRSRSRTRRSRSRDKRSPYETSRDPVSEIPGFSEMSAAEQAEKRLQLAIQAAARADEKIKKETSSSNVTLTFDEQHRRAKALEAIDKDEFMQSEFISTREQKLNTAEDFGHDDAMFGTGPRPTLAKRSELTESKHGDSILHPNFFMSVEDKMPRWIQKLTNMRKKKLEGETFM